MEYIALIVVVIWIGIKKPELAKYLNKSFLFVASLLILYAIVTSRGSALGWLVALEVAVIAFYSFVNRIIMLLSGDNTQ